MSDVISFEGRRNKNADKYADLDGELLEIAMLTDLAIETHFKEAIEGRQISSFGATTDLVLRDLQARIHAVVVRVWDRG